MRRLLTAALLLCTLPAFAQHDHGKNGDWFESLRNGSGMSCCSNADGTAVTDADWETKDGHYRVRLNNQWMAVTDKAVLPGPNKDGRTIVWPRPGPMGIEIICFIPGEMT